MLEPAEEFRHIRSDPLLVKLRVILWIAAANINGPALLSEWERGAELLLPIDAEKVPGTSRTNKLGRPFVQPGFNVSLQMKDLLKSS